MDFCKILQNVVLFSTLFGLDSQSLLERRDGVNPSRAPVLREDDICKCHCGKIALKTALLNVISSRVYDLGDW